MKEDFVQAIWKHQLYSKADLKTIDGNTVQVLKPGVWHSDAGPDFHTAQVIIGNTHWVGNVEIHLSSKDWYRHRHHLDPAYNNVILHVVFTHDGSVCMSECGEAIQTLELSPYIDQKILDRYSIIMQDLNPLPCVDSWGSIDSLSIHHWLTRMCIERFEEKSSNCIQKLMLNKVHWEQFTFELLASQFGFHVNAIPMERVARSIPIEILLKNIDKPLFVEALLFGQAGFLNQHFHDDYPKSLKSEYEFQRKKYNLKTIEGLVWKNSRMRPNNFPHIRLAQFAAVIKSHPLFYRDFLSMQSYAELKSFFKVPIDPYWNEHHHFLKSSNYSVKNLGDDAIEKIILNSITLLWVCYAKYKNEAFFIDKAIEWLEGVKAEKNRYTEAFDKTGFISENAVHSQGLRHLWQHYCDHKKCVHCNIGLKHLKL